MARYLIVAHQTSDSPKLREEASRIAREQPGARFTLLVPATPVEHLASWTRGESLVAARQAGERARLAFEADGVALEDVMVGDANPVYAVADAFNRDRWDHVLVSTLSTGMSRWVKMDVVSRLTREVDVPVSHIEAG